MVSSDTCIFDWVSPDRSYALKLERDPRHLIEVCANQAGHFETGGILLGHYTSDGHVAVVTEATPPPSDSRRGSAWFQRGVSGLRRLLERVNAG